MRALGLLNEVGLDPDALIVSALGRGVAACAALAAADFLGGAADQQPLPDASRYAGGG